VNSRFTASVSGITVNTQVSGSRVQFNIPLLPAGANVVLVIRVKANALTGDNPISITNRVSVSAAETDVNLDDNEAEDQNQINPFFIPNVITPNGDGKNDRFVIKGLQKFSRTEIVIFNRYGDHVYENQQYENDWSAQGQVAGTYFYVLKGTDTEGRIHEFKGWIQVIKN
jgi:gliding motility-associated-like protein